MKKTKLSSAFLFLSRNNIFQPSALQRASATLQPHLSGEQSHHRRAEADQSRFLISSAFWKMEWSVNNKDNIFIFIALLRSCKLAYIHL